MPQYKPQVHKKIRVIPVGRRGLWPRPKQDQEQSRPKAPPTKEQKAYGFLTCGLYITMFFNAITLARLTPINLS